MLRTVVERTLTGTRDSLRGSKHVNLLLKQIAKQCAGRKGPHTSSAVYNPEKTLGVTEDTTRLQAILDSQTKPTAWDTEAHTANPLVTISIPHSLPDPREGHPIECDPPVVTDSIDISDIHAQLLTPLVPPTLDEAITKETALAHPTPVFARLAALTASAETESDKDTDKVQLRHGTSLSTWMLLQAKKILSPGDALREMGHSRMPKAVLTLIGQRADNPILKYANVANVRINTAWREKVLKPVSDAILSRTGFSLRRSQLLLRGPMTNNGMYNPTRTIQDRKNAVLEHVNELRLESSKQLAYRLEDTSYNPTEAQLETIAKLKSGTASTEEVLINFKDKSTEHVELFQTRMTHANERLETYYDTLCKAIENELEIGKDQADRRFTHVATVNAATWVGLGITLSTAVTAVSGVPLTPEATGGLCFATKGAISFTANKYRQRSEEGKEGSGYYSTPTDTESHDWLKYFVISAIMIGLRSALGEDEETADTMPKLDDKLTEPTRSTESVTAPSSSRAPSGSRLSSTYREAIMTASYLLLSITKGTHLFSRIAASTAGQEAVKNEEPIIRTTLRAANAAADCIKDCIKTSPTYFSEDPFLNMVLQKDFDKDSDKTS